MFNTHPLRVSLHNEIHSRPAERVESPMVIRHLVFSLQSSERNTSREHLCQLLRDHHHSEPAPTSNHFRADLVTFKLRWELHTEFLSLTIFRLLTADEQAVDSAQKLSALDAVPKKWLAAMPGLCIVNTSMAVLKPNTPAAQSTLERQGDDLVVGTRVGEGQAQVFTDFSIDPDGVSHWMVLDLASTPKRMGRLVQRLLEIETYRMAALMGLPVARESGALLARCEADLAQLAQDIRQAAPEEEAALLDRLTRLAADVESHYAATHSRFSASSAYFDLVRKRIEDIREERMTGPQTIRGFMDRRLSPAMNTCAWAVRRQQSLSERISRMSSLLQTRVEIEQQEATRELLHTMNERQGVQLKMQSAVEGLSVAAITYYFTGLVGYVVKGAKEQGIPLDPELTTAAAVPLIAMVVWLGVRRLHNKIMHA
ncbi:MAG: hypothetical protein RLZZ397_931 [Pseudomonadota bacterium]|jgi:uncharacterized membrane-anchored protein